MGQSESVSNDLAMGWSLEIIAGQLERERGSRIISHESIYRFVYSPQGRKDGLHRYLRYRRQNAAGAPRKPPVSTTSRIASPSMTVRRTLTAAKTSATYS